MRIAQWILLAACAVFILWPLLTRPDDRADAAGDASENRA